MCTKWDGCILSDTDRNKSTAELGKATWRGRTSAAGREGCSCRRELWKPERGATSWKRDLDKGIEKVEKSTSEEQTGAGKIRRKDLWKPGIGVRMESDVGEKREMGEAGRMTARTDRRPVTDWCVTIGILSPPDLRKEHPGSTTLFCQKKKNPPKLNPKREFMPHPFCYWVTFRVKPATAPYHCVSSNIKDIYWQCKS